MAQGTALLTIVALVALCSMTALASDPAGEKQLQRAIDLLERNEVPRAAALFADVARSTDPALAGRALLYLGAAQRRQGQDEQASSTYRRILQQFPQQKDVASEARLRLAGLERPTASGAPASHRVLTGADADPLAHLTPDGRFLSRADRQTGDVVMRDMTTGRTKRLVVTRDTLDASPDRAELAMVSPDGSRIVYVWMFRGEGNNARYELRLMRNEAGAPSQVLVNSPRGNLYFEPIGWSRDAQSVLVTAWTSEGTNGFAWVSLNNGAVRPLKDLGRRLGRTRPRLSPDGEFVVYSALPTSPETAQEARAALDAGPLHLYMLPTAPSAQGREIELVKGGNINESPVWAPDGRRILFVSNRSADGFGLWSLEVDQGRGLGERRIRADVAGRIQPVGMTKSGTRYYVPEAAGGTGLDVFVADVDAESGRVNGRASRLLDTVVDRSFAPSWSPDGERVAFKRRRASGTVPRNLEPVEVVIQSQKTGREEAVFPLDGLDDRPPLWLDNDRYLLLRSSGGLGRLDRKTGRVSPLESIAHSRLPMRCGPFALSHGSDDLSGGAGPDCLESAESAEPEGAHLPRRGIRRGDRRSDGRPASAAGHGARGAGRQPRRERSAITLQREASNAPRLAIVEVRTGTLQELPTVSVPRTASWTRAGLFVSREGERRTDVVRVSLPDGRVTPTGLAYARGQFFDVRPDGQRVVFSDRTRPEEEELWAYENLLSSEKPVH